MLSNYFDVPIKVGKTTYSDKDDIHEWALSSVKGMTDTKHFVRTGNNCFSPSSLVTRAQATQILMSFANVIEDTAILVNAEKNSRLEYGATGVWESTIKLVVVGAREVILRIASRAPTNEPSFYTCVMPKLYEEPSTMWWCIQYLSLLPSRFLFSCNHPIYTEKKKI